MSNWVSGLRRLGLIGIFAGAALALWSVAAQAQTFSTTGMPTNPTTKASYPNMVTDTQGNLNVVWIDSVAGIQFARSTSSASGTSFPGRRWRFYPRRERVGELFGAAFDPAPPARAPLSAVFKSRSNLSGLPGS